MAQGQPYPISAESPRIGIWVQNDWETLSNETCFTSSASGAEAVLAGLISFSALLCPSPSIRNKVEAVQCIEKTCWWWTCALQARLPFTCHRGNVNQTALSFLQWNKYKCGMQPTLLGNSGIFFWTWGKEGVLCRKNGKASNNSLKSLMLDKVQMKVVSMFKRRCLFACLFWLLLKFKYQKNKNSEVVST